MADITMCKGDDCPLKKNCYRYLAEAEDVDQTYFGTPPFSLVDNKPECKFYWFVDKNES